MGCDIHFHTEIKVDGQWHHYDRPRLPRNYLLFAKLANVRNSDKEVTPISLPRGIPDDASFTTKFCSDEWGIDGHSHSYIRSDEIPELEQWLIDSFPDILTVSVEYKLWGYLFGNSYSGFMKYPEDRPKDLEDVRFVFWFDN